MSDFVQVSGGAASVASFGGDEAPMPKPQRKDDPLTMLVRQHLAFDESYNDPLLAHYIFSGIALAERYSGTRTSVEKIEYADRLSAAMTLRARHKDLDESSIKVQAMVNGRWAPVPFWAHGDVITLDSCNPGDLIPGSPVRLSYCIGECSIEAWMNKYPDLVQGILVFVAHAYENAGDAPNNWATESGALVYWKRHGRRAG